MGWGGQGVRVVDAFYKGGETIPGFASAGLGPRDATTGDALGATTFYSATTELRYPLPFVPQDLGLSGAVYTAVGSAFGTDAQKFAAAYAAQHGTANTLVISEFVGFEVVRRHKPHLGFAGRRFTRRLFLRPEQGRLRQDAGVRLRL